MITYKVVLDQRRPKSDGTCPIVFRITFNRKSANYSTGIFVSKNYWSVEGKTITRTCPNYKELNKSLTAKFLKLQKVILDLEDNDAFSFEILKEKMNDNKPKVFKVPSFWEYAKQLIEEMLEINRTGNAIVYQTGVNRFIAFCDNKNLQFKEIDYKLLISFKQHLIKGGVKINTVGNYLRTIRAIFNKAIKARIVERSYYPFSDIQIKTEKTTKRALTIADLRKIYKSEYIPLSPKWNAKNYFLLSLSLRGISFTDMAYLSKQNISNGRVEYKRRKTKTHLSICLHPFTMHILSLYQSTQSDYLLPVLPGNLIEDSIQAKKILNQWIKTTNKWLRAIAKDCKIDAKVTTYVSRHSWATLAKRKGYSNELIAEGLGHLYGNKITNIYLDSFDQDLVDEVNNQVLALLIS